MKWNNATILFVEQKMWMLKRKKKLFEFIHYFVDSRRQDQTKWCESVWEVIKTDPAKYKTINILESCEIREQFCAK